MANCIIFQSGSVEEKGNPYPQEYHTLPLYLYGDKCVANSGGWYNMAGSTTYATDNMYLNTSAELSTINLINHSGYSKIYLEVKNDTTSSTLFDLLNSSKSVITSARQTFNNTTSMIKTYIDISSYQDSYYYRFYAVNSKMRVYCTLLLKDDNITTLASKCGSTATTIDGLLADSTKLFSSQDGVYYMLSCMTGEFMINACQCVNFVDAMSASEYASLFMSNEVWGEYLIAFSPKKLFLYADGIESSESGGWTIDGYSRGSRSVTSATKNSNSIYTKGASNTTNMLGTKNPIDVTNYTKFMSKANADNNNNYCVVTCLYSTKSDTTTNHIINFSTSGLTTKSYDITSLTGNYYPRIESVDSSSNSGYTYQVWLEKE